MEKKENKDPNKDDRGRFCKGNKAGRPFQPGNKAGKGRQPLPVNTIKALPKDARDKVYEVLWTAIAMTNVKEAQAYIEDQAKELPECGFALQVCLRALLGKNGFLALMDICDRLFGKPAMAHKVDMDATVQGVTVNVSNPETAQVLQEIMDKGRQ